MDFKIAPNNVIKVPMMYMKPEKAKFNYTDLGDLEILELPYKGGKVSMLILLPSENISISVIESNLTVEKLKEWKEQMKETVLNAIYLPKFEFEKKYFLEQNLKNLGMISACDPGRADFSGMTGWKGLFIQHVIHHSYVKVNEEGTEAAGATAVIMRHVASEKIFKADHPFIFVIQQRDTGNILFIGRVVNPTK